MDISHKNSRFKGKGKKWVRIACYQRIQRCSTAYRPLMKSLVLNLFARLFIRTAGLSSDTVRPFSNTVRPCLNTVGPF